MSFEELEGTVGPAESVTQIQVALRTNGLPDSLEPYRASIDVAVTSQENTTFRLEVSFFVSAVDGRPCPPNTWFVHAGCDKYPANLPGGCIRCPPELVCGTHTTVATATVLPGFWRADPNSTTATSCDTPAGINCTGDTTRATITLDHGYWRHTSATMDVR